MSKSTTIFIICIVIAVSAYAQYPGYNEADKYSDDELQPDNFGPKDSGKMFQMWILVFVFGFIIYLLSKDKKR